MCMSVRVELTAGVFCHFPLCFLTRSLTEPGAHWLVRLAGQQAVGASCDQKHAIPCPVPHVGARDLNSGPRAYTTGTLHTEPSPQNPLVIFK